MIIHIDYKDGGYDILLEKGALSKVASDIQKYEKVIVVTDDGVPRQYAQRVAKEHPGAEIYTVPAGEGSKSFSVLEKLLAHMLSRGFTRKDCVVAVGGGVVGDLSGFASSIYMRGIDFYNAPTTLLSQVDSSIGGKTAINLEGVKNIVGSFYRPKKVYIDPILLDTLDERQFAGGMAEALKMALTSDKTLFELIERMDVHEEIETIIERALRIKKSVVEEDEKEKGLRRILNFGHTIGHGLESACGLGGLLHGECVALGIIPMCSPYVRARLLPIYGKLGLPSALDFDEEEVYEAMRHDKKASGDRVSVVLVKEIGKWEIEEIPINNLKDALRIIPKE